MNKYITVSTTFDNKEEADKIIKILLEKRLVSCCQISNITSVYHWEGKIENENEYLVQMKTRRILYKEIERIILDNHSYKTPQIVCYEIIEGSKEYLDWIEKETKNFIETV